MEHKYQQAAAMMRAKEVILETAGEFAALTGRAYGLFEEYRMADAERALVLIGSSAGTAKAAVDVLRNGGEKVGLIKLRVFRPFPMAELARALSGLKAAAVMDKAESFSGCGGPLFAEIRSACCGSPDAPILVDYIYGLGGRDVRVESILSVYRDLAQIADTGAPEEIYRYLDVRAQCAQPMGE
jgi:pyruvate ferredoxin oxidoreductase alpha subunit